MSLNKRAGLEAVLERIGTLGAGSAQPLKLLGTLGADATSASDVRHVMDLDPMLATRVLRVANSAFYGRSREIGTVDRAVAVLGFNTLRAIAAAASLDQTLTRIGVSRERAAQLLRHSLFTAVAAQRLARREGEVPEGDAFMGGLLHDIGCLAALVAAGDGGAARAFEATPAAPGEGLVDPEQEHAALSRRLLERWQLPPWLCDCAGRHHDPVVEGGDAAGALVTIVRTADAVAAAAGWSHAADLERFEALAAGVPPGAAPQPPVAEEALVQAVIAEVEALTQALGAN